MRTEKFDIASAVCKIAGIRFCLVCKILKYELGDTSAVNTLMSIAQIDEGELNRLRELINGMFFEAEKMGQEALEREISDGSIDINCAIENDMEELVECIISYIKDEKQKQARSILINIYLKAHGEQKIETVRKEINHVFDCARELRLKKFLRLSKAIVKAAMPFENGKPIAELKETTTEAIKLVRAWRLGQKELKWYMDSEISKIYLCRAMREYEELWEQAKDASADETVELIYQAIQGIENKVKANFDFEQDEIKAINEMIKVSLFEAGVQYPNDGGEIFKDLIDIFAEQGILYRGSDEWYNLLSKISENFK